MPNSRIPDDRIDFWHFTPSRSSGATRLLACCLAFWALPCAYVPLDIDTFAMDQSGTAKEHVGRTE